MNDVCAKNGAIGSIHINLSTLLMSSFSLPMFALRHDSTVMHIETDSSTMLAPGTAAVAPLSRLHWTKR